MLVVIMAAIVSLACFSWFLQSRKIRRQQQREQRKEKQEAMLRSLLELKPKDESTS